MVSQAERIQIITLSNAGNSQRDIQKRTGISLRTIQYTLKRHRETGLTQDRPRSGRPATAVTPRNVKVVRMKINRNPQRSMRRMASELNISTGSVRNIVKTRLGLRPIKMQPVHALSDKSKKNRFEKSRILLQRFSSARHREILFTDEKLFTVEQAFNKQNCRILAQSTEEASKKGRYVSRRGHALSVMVWAGITANGKTPLVFVPKGVKINAQTYLDDILKKVVEPWASQHFGNSHWTYQQDSAPAHKAKIVQDWCSGHFPDLITPSEWPPYSPDLNPMDFSVWSVLEAKACTTPHASLSSLKAALEKAWDELDVDYLRATVDAFPKRLRACVKAKGGYFEL